MSQIKVDSIVPRAGSPSGGGGGIIQVVSAFKGDRFTTNSESFVDITGMSVTITPKSNTSKILVMGCFGMASVTQSNLDHGHAIKILRNGSDNNKLNGVTNGNRGRICMRGAGVAYNNDHALGGFAFTGVDDPATTSALTYKVQVACQLSSRSFTLNSGYNYNNTTNIYDSTSMSSIVAMEITV